MRIPTSEKSRKKPSGVVFDGVQVTAAAESPRVIRVQSYSVSEADQGGSLAIRGGENFVIGAYRICAVDCGSNTWTLDRACCTGQASGLVGRMQPYEGKPHAEVAEYYDPTLPDNASRGAVLDRVLWTLDQLEPRILRTLADTCFKDELLDPKMMRDGDWPLGSSIHLDWEHVRKAGEIMPSDGAVLYGNLKPLRDALTLWAQGGPDKLWNLCDEKGNPVDWVAGAAVEALVFWKERGGLPKVLDWGDFKLRPYMSLETVEDYRIFDLEEHFNSGAGYVRITGATRVELPRLSDRQQRQAKREYHDLGRKRGLRRMPKASPHYVNWYVLYTFLGLTQNEIREWQKKHGAAGIGDMKDPKDLVSVSIGIRTIADLVGFRRQPRKRTRIS